MKKMYLVITIMFMLLLFGCVKEEVVVQKDPPTPAVILSELDAENAINNEFELVVASETDVDENTKKITYVSEPIGKTDSISVQITSPSETLSIENIEDMYKQDYEKRVNKQRIEDVGSSSFAAFPMIYILERGYMIKITAGSGDTQNQLDLLKSLGQKAVENLNVYLDGEEKE